MTYFDSLTGAKFQINVAVVAWPSPEEISLAHHWVLFLDELPEFGQRVLEVMRQAMEDPLVTISRAKTTLTFPANFMLVGAMNPCPCGYYGDALKECTCSPAIVTRYQKRLSGPLLHRIDTHVEVPRVEYEKLARTIADLGGEGEIIPAHLAEAIQYRPQRQI